MRQSMSSPAASAFARACSIIRGAKSTPVTRWPASAASRARLPVPQPRSTTSDGGEWQHGAQQVPPGGAYRRVAQPVIGRLVEPLGLAVPVRRGLPALTGARRGEKGWGGRRDSNPRLPAPQASALPTELRPPRSPTAHVERPRVYCTAGADPDAPCCANASTTCAAAACACSEVGPGSCTKARAVVVELADGLEDVRERAVAAVLARGVVVDAREPALHELLDGGHVDAAVVQVGVDLGHALRTRNSGRCRSCSRRSVRCRRW